MEDAYSELYQQFVRLRSLCLKQAAMLHQLTAALHKQQGASIPTADVSDLMSIPVQSTYEMPVYPHEKPQLGAAAAHQPAEQCGIDRISRNVGIFTDLLAEDMSRLSMDLSCQTQEEVKAKPKAPFVFNMDSESQEASYSAPKHPGQSPPGGETAHTLRMPVADGPSLGGGNFRCQSGGALMSDVALQSHVCEFCQAVFPGNSTTRGEFLRHLYTHVT